MAVTGSLGVLFLYAYNGDPQAAELDTINPEKGALVIDATNGLVYLKSAAAGSNTDGDLPAFRGLVLEGKATVTDAATFVVDTTAARVHQITLAGNRTANFTGHKAGREFYLAVKQDATGSRTVTWDADVVWSGGTAPTLTTTAAKTDVFHFIDDGTKYIGRTVGLNYTI